ncbi:MAG: hypothetical protein ACFC1C_02030 [Candidatus Malihini olakiniferum]
MQTAYRDYSAECSLFTLCALVAFISILLLSGVLATNLYHLQLVHVEDYCTLLNTNRINCFPSPPAASIIYDHNGIPLALNRTIYQLELVLHKGENLQDTLLSKKPIVIKPIINLTEDNFRNFERERKRSRR